MAQYKTVPYESVENSEIARKAYLDFECGKDSPDENEAESVWIADKERLRRALDTLTPKQRKVFVLKAGHLRSEAEIADAVEISQSAVSQFYRAAERKLKKYAGKTTDKE